ncbi:MAG: elongation factor Ts [bacterium]|nr:elongation factor Ts [bacterium]
MPTISVADIQALRERTGVGMLDAKNALEAASGDIDAAVTTLRKSGQKVAEKKAARVTREGVVGVYEHSNKKLVAVVAVACETDFVARTEDFQTLAHELAMHVAAAAPTYLTAADIPADVLATEEDIARSQAKGKPEKILASIIQGKLKKYAEEHCLMEQKFFKDDTKTVSGVVQEAMQKLGENIQVKEFVRLSV